VTFDRSAPLNEQVDALLGTEARRWIKTLPPERQEWLERLGPQLAFPEWLIDMGPGGDFIPLADQIAAFAEAHLPPGIQEGIRGAMGDSIYVMAASRLLPAGRPLRDRLFPLLDEVWGALNDNDHLAAALVLPAIAALGGQARQMLDDFPRSAGPGSNSGPTYIGRAYVEAIAEVIRRVDTGERERQADVINELAQSLPGDNTELTSKKTQLRDGVRKERLRISKRENDLRGL